MKRDLVSALFLLSASFLHAQEVVVLHKHELRASLGEAIIIPSLRDFDGKNYTNFSLSYLYRTNKFFWIGMNYVNYIGTRTYTWREYYSDSNFDDFSKSNSMYCAFVAPEIRFSCINKRSVHLYGGLSAGVGIRTRYIREQKHTDTFGSLHLTFLGLSCNFGQNKNIFLGGELGIGFKGLYSIHGGYRF